MTKPRRAAWSVGVVAVLAVAGCGISVDAPEPVVATVTAPAEPVSPSPSLAPTASADPQGAAAVDARWVVHAGNTYLVAALPLDEWDLRIDWDPEADGAWLSDAIERDPAVAVATNAGIFTPSFAPGGLLVSDGVVLRDLNLADGAGNFHLMPNGVFAVYDDGTAAVVDSTAYVADGVSHATQSGPALLLDGALHPAFNEGSTNLALRSGVGVSPDGDTVFLSMSWSFTNFYDFATMFRDELGCEDALYLDGQISDLWVTGMEMPGPFYGPYAGIITARPHGG